MDDSPFHRFQSLKILRYSDRLEAIAKGDLPLPVTWHIYPTNACNRKCPHCIMDQIGEKQKGGELTLPQLVRLVVDAQMARVTLMHFSGGGEPLLNRNLCEVLAVDRFRVALSTNGILLTQEIADHVEYLRVSIDAGTREHYERVSGVDAFDKVVANLKAIKPKGDLGLAMLVTDDEDVDWFKETDGLWCLAYEIRADFVHVRPAWYADAKRTTQAVVNTGLTGFDFRGRLHVRRDKFESRFTRCIATPLQVLVTANGEYALCQDRPDLTFGRVEDGFEAAWYGERHRELLRMNLPDEKCPRCVLGPYHEIIERCFVRDEMRMALV